MARVAARRQASKFRGIHEGDGHTLKAPYLARLAGGIKAFEREDYDAPDPAFAPQTQGKPLTESQKLAAAARAAAANQGGRM